MCGLEAMKEQIIYLDNAATTFPKPRSVLERMVETYGRMGVSPGRGSYDLAVEAEELVQATRRQVARILRRFRPGLKSLSTSNSH